MPRSDEIAVAVEKIASTDNWNKRVALIRKVPEIFGNAQHRSIYGAIAKAVYVSELTPDFAYVDWRDGYELAPIEKAYARAYELSNGFKNVSVAAIARTIQREPVTLRIFRLLLGLTTQEFAASTTIIGGESETPAGLSNSTVKAIEGGRTVNLKVATVLAGVIDQAMRGVLFTKRSGEVRSKISKPDTAKGWKTVRRYATENVPFPVFLHQRHYGGAFRQLLDATSGRRGDLLEQVVEEIFNDHGILFVRTGSSNQAVIATKFGLTVKPAPDFVVHDANGAVKAILECKQANDGGTARDKAARFASLRNEVMRLGGIPLFAVLAGLGWRRTADTLGPVVRDTDGRVFTIQTIGSMITVEPFPGLVAKNVARK